VVTASEHWSSVWSRGDPASKSWFEPVPDISLALIEEAGLPRDAAVADVGGGASGLAVELLHRGHRDVTVVDVSAEALAAARERLGDAAGSVDLVQADVLHHDFGRRLDLWHDRALLHFMVAAADRAAYVDAAARAVRPRGHLVVATFGPDGPTRCSGLDVRRYGEDELAETLAPAFEPVSSRLVEHRTPSGAEQQFLYAHLRRAG
jgi:SAM-dependent methyltransferase